VHTGFGHWARFWHPRYAGARSNDGLWVSQWPAAADSFLPSRISREAQGVTPDSGLGWDLVLDRGVWKVGCNDPKSSNALGLDCN
jgi:hypothetical protein